MMQFALYLDLTLSKGKMFCRCSLDKMRINYLLPGLTF